MFEGTAPQMYASLSKLAGLPGETRVYCGHEYTQANARFALTIEPGNAALKSRASKIDALRAKGLPTVPATLAEERATNPFLRAREKSVAQAVALDARDPVAVFAEVRARKDRF